MQSEKSIKKNSMYYMFYQVVNVLFPFISAIYVARVLLPDAVGKVVYAQNVAGYFATLSFLGIPTYGLREISKSRNIKDNLSKIYSELMVINSISTLCFTVIYYVLIFSVNEYRKNIVLYTITGCSIVLNLLNNSWLYEGLEEFRYISIRNIVFKTMSFLLLLFLVREPEDYINYAIISVIGTAGNYVLNILHSKKIVYFSMHDLDLGRHIKPILFLVVVNLAIELYSMVDVTMLGIFSNEKSVACYSYAQKIYRLFSQIINTFTIVTVPRLALHFTNNNQKDFNILIAKTFKIILLLAVPLIIGIEILSKDVVVLLYGLPFLQSSYILNIISVLLIVSPIGYLLGSRTLLVTGNENKMVFPVVTGAIINIIGNVFLIPLYAEIGAAVASVISEICVMVIYVILGKKYFRIYNVGIELLKIIICSTLMGLSVYFFRLILQNEMLRFLIQLIVGTIVYFVLMLILKEEIVLEYKDVFLRKVVEYKNIGKHT